MLAGTTNLALDNALGLGRSPQAPRGSASTAQGTLSWGAEGLSWTGAQTTLVFDELSVVWLTKIEHTTPHTGLNRLLRARPRHEIMLQATIAQAGHRILLQATTSGDLAEATIPLTASVNEGSDVPADALVDILRVLYLMGAQVALAPALSVIEPLMTLARRRVFREGRGRVNFGLGWGYLNLSEDVVIPGPYAAARHFNHGHAVVKFADGPGDWGVIDREGNVRCRGFRWVEDVRHDKVWAAVIDERMPSGLAWERRTLDGQRSMTAADRAQAIWRTQGNNPLHWTAGFLAAGIATLIIAVLGAVALHHLLRAHTVDACLEGSQTACHRLLVDAGDAAPEMLSAITTQAPNALVDGDLSHTQLQRANLRRKNLRGADFSQAHLEGAHLGHAHLENSHWTYADMRDVRLSHAHLNNANLSYANLSGADLREVHGTHTTLSGANLKGTDLRRANMSHAMLPVADLRRANAEESTFTHASLRAARLQSARFHRANLTGVRMPFAKADGIILTLATLRDADMHNASLIGADLRSAHLSNAQLNRAILRGADLSFANLEGANLKNADLRDANLYGANLRGALLDGADFRGADLTAANLPDHPAHISIDATTRSAWAKRHAQSYVTKEQQAICQAITDPKSRLARGCPR